MRPARLLFLFLFLPSLVCAHQLTVRPLRVELRADSRKVRVTITAHLSYWMEDILEVRSLPASHWPEELRRKSKDYIDSHLSLTVNGQRLSGVLEDCRYIEDLWDIRPGGHVVFRLVYPLPTRAPAGSSLSVRSSFYSEALEDLNEIPDPAERNREAGWFRTDVMVLGRTPRTFSLTPALPEFSVPWRDSLETSSETAAEYREAGERWIFVQFSLALFVLAACLRLAPVRTSLGGFLVFLLFFSFAYLLSLSFPHTEELLWGCVIAAAAAAWFRFSRPVWWMVLGLGAWEAGSAAAGVSTLQEAPQEYLFAARWSFETGVIVSVMILALVISFALILARRRFQRIYVSLGEKIFLSYLRFLSQAVIAVSAYFLFHGLMRQP